MLTRINIKNYKLFQDFTLENIPQFLLIGGKNNCGKTSLLEAIFLLLDNSDPTMFLKSALWRGMDQFSTQPSSLFEFAYHNFDLNQPIKMEYTINSLKRKREYKFVPEKTVPFIIDKETKSIDMSKKLGSLGGMEISYWLNEEQTKPYKDLLKCRRDGMDLVRQNNTLEMSAIFLPSTFFGTSKGEDARRYGELDRVNKTKGIVTALQILEPRLRDLSIIPLGNQPTIYGDIGIGRKIPLQLMGQGIARLTSILLAISRVKNGVVLVDEFENGFHHSIMPKIWKVVATHAKANNTQIMATTHSRELIQSALQGIPKDLKDKFQYVRIERNNNIFKTKQYDKEILSIALDSNLAIR